MACRRAPASCSRSLVLRALECTEGSSCVPLSLLRHRVIGLDGIVAWLALRLSWVSSARVMLRTGAVSSAAHYCSEVLCSPTCLVCLVRML